MLTPEFKDKLRIVLSKLTTEALEIILSNQGSNLGETKELLLELVKEELNFRRNYASEYQI